MSAPHDLLAIGRIGVDLYPEQVGPLADVRTFAKSLGGSAANVAVAAARLGRSVALATRVGDDRLGRYLVRALEQFGVDAELVSSHPTLKTPLVIAELDPPEDPSLDFYRAPSAPDLELTRAQLVDADAGRILRAARVVWLTGTGLSAEPSRGATLAAGSVARHHGQGEVVFDLDWRPQLWADPFEAPAAYAELLQHATVVVGNRTEVAVALGEDPDAGAVIDPEEAARALLERGARLAVVKLGADGVLMATGVGMYRVEPIEVDVVCGLGAGDAFGGALVHGLLSGWDPVEIGRFANAAGAYVAGQLACADAMPTVDQVEALLDSAAQATRSS